MRSPKTIKDVQALNRKITPLGRFYETLKRVMDKKDFVSEETQNELKKLKIALGKLPALASLIPE